METAAQRVILKLIEMNEKPIDRSRIDYYDGYQAAVGELINFMAMDLKNQLEEEINDSKQK